MILWSSLLLEDLLTRLKYYCLSPLNCPVPTFIGKWNAKMGMKNAKVPRVRIICKEKQKYMEQSAFIFNCIFHMVPTVWGWGLKVWVWLGWSPSLTPVRFLSASRRLLLLTNTHVSNSAQVLSSKHLFSGTPECLQLWKIFRTHLRQHQHGSICGWRKSQAQICQSLQRENVSGWTRPEVQLTVPELWMK